MCRNDIFLKTRDKKAELKWRCRVQCQNVMAQWSPFTMSGCSAFVLFWFRWTIWLSVWEYWVIEVESVRNDRQNDPSEMQMTAEFRKKSHSWCHAGLKAVSYWRCPRWAQRIPMDIRLLRPTCCGAPRINTTIRRYVCIVSPTSASGVPFNRFGMIFCTLATQNQEPSNRQVFFFFSLSASCIWFERWNKSAAVIHKSERRSSRNIWRVHIWWIWL